MDPTERFVLPRGRYVEQPPDLEYEPTGTKLAKALERELDARAWSAGQTRGNVILTIDEWRTVESVQEEKVNAEVAKLIRAREEREFRELRQHGSAAPFGRGEETMYDETIRRCTQIEGERVRAEGTGWDAACEGIRAALVTEMGLMGCDIELDVHKLLLYEQGDHFALHADTEKSEGMIASAVVVLESRHAGGALVMAHEGSEARLIEGQAPDGFVQWAVWYADVAHQVENLQHGHRIAVTLNVRLGERRPIKAREIRDSALDARLWRRTYEHRHYTWARRAVLRGTGTRQYARKLVWLLGHRYTEPGLRGELLKGRDRQLAAVLGTGYSHERVLLGWVEMRTVGDVEHTRNWRWNDNDPHYYKRRRVDHERSAAEYEEDRAGLDLAPHDEYWDEDYAMTRVEVPEGLPVLKSGDTVRRDLWVEGLRDLDGERTDYGRIALETCELAPSNTVNELRTSGARVYEATGNEGATLELQYRHAALIVWQPNESALDMLAECGGRTALAAEFAMARRWPGSRAFDTYIHDVARRWKRDMMADGGGPAPQAHRTLLAALREDEKEEYACEIATCCDLDEAGAEVVAQQLRTASERTHEVCCEALQRLIKGRWRWNDRQENDSGACTLLEHLLTDESGRTIAKRLCAREDVDGVREEIEKLKRAAHRREYETRRSARWTRDYPGDGMARNEEGDAPRGTRETAPGRRREGEFWVEEEGFEWCTHDMLRAQAAEMMGRMIDSRDEPWYVAELVVEKGEQTQ